jgi:hypothetical protein
MFRKYVLVIENIILAINFFGIIAMNLLEYNFHNKEWGISVVLALLSLDVEPHRNFTSQIIYLPVYFKNHAHNSFPNAYKLFIEWTFQSLNKKLCIACVMVWIQCKECSEVEAFMKEQDHQGSDSYEWIHNLMALLGGETLGGKAWLQLPHWGHTFKRFILFPVSCPT